MPDERGTIQFENGSKEAIPAPPAAMLDIIIMQLEGAISSAPAPNYVKEACAAFIESLKRWGKEGAN
jgi:hypothetical protein